VLVEMVVVEMEEGMEGMVDCRHRRLLEVVEMGEVEMVGMGICLLHRRVMVLKWNLDIDNEWRLGNRRIVVMVRMVLVRMVLVFVNEVWMNF
jgi:hypothetical protein